MSPERPSLRRILSDTSRIISAHSRHFLALSILFLFPSSFIAAIYILLSNPLETLYLRFLTIFSTGDYEIPAIGNSQLLFSLTSLFFSTCAVSSIAASTVDGFYGRPVELISALRSVLRSFLPLLATTLVAEIIVGLIAVAFVGLLLLANNSIGFDIDYYHNEYFLVLFNAIEVSMVAVLIYFLIEWSLASVVVVVESDWGFAALRRSSYLVKGARGVMFLFLLLFGVLTGILGICYLKFVVIEGGSSDWLVVKIAVYAGFSTLLSLYGVAAHTVFFIYCKASRHELEFAIDGKLGREYVRLPYYVDVV